MDIEENRTCLVEVRERNANSEYSSCSGIYVNSNYVLTVGNVILPILSKNFGEEQLSGVNLSLKYLLSRDCHGPELFKKIQCRVIFDNNFERLNSNTLQIQHLKGSRQDLNHVEYDVESKYLTRNGNIEFLWKCENFSKALKQTFPKHASWNLGDGENIDQEKTASKSEKQSNQSVKGKQPFEPEDVENFLPYFAIIKLNGNSDDVVRNLHGIIHPSRVMIGETLSIQGTPFGNLSPSVFMNSVSRGVLCNKTGVNSELLLTDARCIPGCEGGGLYVGDYRSEKLLGIIVSPLCWKSTEWVGLAIACSVAELLNSLEDHLQGRGINPVFRDIPSALSKPADAEDEKGMADLSTTYKHVVMIQCAGSWGTGVLIDSRRGYILTCGHVVKNSPSVRVRFDIGTRVWMDAEVVYSKPDVVAFDIAILKLLHPGKLKMAECRSQPVSQAKQGEEAFVIGHALFGKEHELGASVSAGVISTVVRRNGVPVLLQSTCAVHNGASGGALVGKAGALLGIVVCNAKDVANESSYPHINLSVPIDTIWPAIQSYIRTQDKAVLRTLEVEDELVHRFWQLKKEGRPAMQSSNI